MLLQNGILLQRLRKPSFVRTSISWLGLGDNNTDYFHRMVATRRSINHIHYLVDDCGTRFESQQSIQEHCLDYFSSLLGGHVDPPLFEESDLNLLLPFSCSISTRKLVQGLLK